MVIGIVYTSSAPPESSACAANDTASPVMSSILQRSSATLSRQLSGGLPSSPRNERTQFARSKRFEPMPQPTHDTRIVGMEENSPAKCFRSAAPVGVQSSLSISPAYIGMSWSRRAVAGAGTGSMPCAHFT